VSAPVDLAPVSSVVATAALRRAGLRNPMLGFDTPGLAADLPADGLCTTAPEGADAAARLIGTVGAWAGTSERRVAASLVVMGYAARLVGPTVAVMLRDGIMLDARPRQVRYRYRTELGFRLGVPDARACGGKPDALYVRWCRDIVDDHLAGLIGAVRAAAPVAVGLLWGNVASVLGGALHALTRDGDVPLATGHSAGLELLGYGPLRGTGELTIHEGQLRFVRRSCCLYYRLDGGGMCGDCCLHASNQ
jgi:ferric iron reductase protein FhuF